MRSTRSMVLLAIATALAISACRATIPGSPQGPQASQHALITSLEIALANRLTDDAFRQQLARRPQLQTCLGIHASDDRWDDLSDAYASESRALLKQAVTNIRQSVDRDKLDHATRLSLRFFSYQVELADARWPWRFYNYPVNPVSGIQAAIPEFLINIHPANSEQDLVHYVARLKGIKPLFDQLLDSLRERARRGIVPARFLFPEVIATSGNVISGAPFTGGDDSPLLADFRDKVMHVKLAPERRSELTALAEKALTESVGPAYEELIAYLTELEKTATDEAGAWKLPDGEAFYKEALESATSTDLTPDQIHQIGRDEVSRIHSEMTHAMQEANFPGPLDRFFETLRTDEKFYFPDTPKGRQAYLDLAIDLMGGMNQNLDELVSERPDADLIVKAVEPLREANAPAASYDAPAPDGSRPAIFHVNLVAMRDLPTWGLEALVYHQGVPGLHLALARAVANKKLPRFRRLARIPAWEEGWALYMEGVPGEIGFYRDPYSDFGRLASELRHACELVTDTGIHARRWTREQAIRYLDDNAPGSHELHTREVEREIVLPGQATAATIGLLKIRELRKRATEQLGEKFDLRQFHEWILEAGPLPLPLLEEEIARRLSLSPAK